jgi:hypothetical protein
MPQETAEKIERSQKLFKGEINQLKAQVHLTAQALLRRKSNP